MPPGTSAVGAVPTTLWAMCAKAVAPMTRRAMRAVAVARTTPWATFAAAAEPMMAALSRQAASQPSALVGRSWPDALWLGLGKPPGSAVLASHAAQTQPLGLTPVPQMAWRSTPALAPRHAHIGCGGTGDGLVFARVKLAAGAGLADASQR
jgi:hypothetical protein